MLVFVISLLAGQADGGVKLEPVRLASPGLAFVALVRWTLVRPDPPSVEEVSVTARGPATADRDRRRTRCAVGG